MNGLPVTFFAGTILYSYLWEAFTEFSETTVAHYTLHWAVVPKNCSFKEHRLLKKLAHHPEIFFIPFSKKKHIYLFIPLAVLGLVALWELLVVACGILFPAQGTWASCTETRESYPLDHQESPSFSFILKYFSLLW